jgi:hypothetical protein
MQHDHAMKMVRESNWLKKAFTFIESGRCDLLLLGSATSLKSSFRIAVRLIQCIGRRYLSIGVNWAKRLDFGLVGRWQEEPHDWPALFTQELKKMEQLVVVI